MTSIDICQSLCLTPRHLHLTELGTQSYSVVSSQTCIRPSPSWDNL